MNFFRSYYFTSEEYPQTIITEIKIDSDTGEVVATVTPSVNLKDNSGISSVMIVCGYSSEVK